MLTRTGTPQVCFILWLLSAPLALPAQEVSAILVTDPVIVEATVSNPYREIPAWAFRIRDALASAPLKDRTELTERDRAQVLLLANDVPELKSDLRLLERLSRTAKFKRTLSQFELATLSAAYARVEAKLEDIPDALMPRCGLERAYGSRRRLASCGLDYGRIGDERVTWSAKRVEPSQSLVVEHDRATLSSKPLPPLDDGEHQVDVSIGDVPDGTTGVALIGETFFERARYRALARVLPAMRPRGTLQVQLPNGTAIMLSSADRLRVLGGLPANGKSTRVLMIPRAAGLRYALTCDATGRLDGGVVYLDESQSGRQRLMPLRTHKAVVTGDARMRPELDVIEVDLARSFLRYALSLEPGGANAVVRVRHYDDALDSAPGMSELIEPVAGEAVTLADLRFEWLEVSERRVRYRIQRVDENWRARVDSNHRPRPSEGRTLSN